jgi:predicted nucleotide-binding protein
MGAIQIVLKGLKGNVRMGLPREDVENCEGIVKEFATQLQQAAIKANLRATDLPIYQTDTLSIVKSDSAYYFVFWDSESDFPVDESVEYIDDTSIHYSSSKEVARKITFYGGHSDFAFAVYIASVSSRFDVPKLDALAAKYIKKVQSRVNRPENAQAKVATAEEPQRERSKRVFVVHGHDEGMKEAVARVLSELKLEPIILHEKPNQGSTIIEKFIEFSDVGYAVVLLSPDDMAYAKGIPPRQAKSRARQNVIFELGFFIGTLGRKNVCALHRSDGNFDLLTDYNGVLYVPYDDAGRWRFTLVRELRASGYDVNANDIL